MEEKKTKKKKQTKPEKGGGVVGNIMPVEETEVYKTQTFQVYGIWKSLPPVMRELSDADLETRFGIDSDVIKKLLKIRTQTQFAEEYKINKDTLTEWNERLQGTSVISWIRQWGRGMTKNMVLAGYQNATSKSGTAFLDRQFFIKLMDQYEEKSVVKVEGLADWLLQALGSDKK